MTGSIQVIDRSSPGSAANLNSSATPAMGRCWGHDRSLSVSMKSMTMARRAGLAAAGIVAAGVVVLGGSAMADAATATPSPSTSSSTAAGSGRGGSADTAVTGDELAKVTVAVKAKDSTITVTSVRKDPDGSYDVLGTKAGANVMYDVSADLATVTQNAGGGHGASQPSTSTGGPTS